MLEQLLTEQFHPPLNTLMNWPRPMFSVSSRRPMRKYRPPWPRKSRESRRAVDAIAAALERGGHLVYIGAGTSGRWASWMQPSARRRSTSLPNWSAASSPEASSALARPVEAAEDDPAAGARDLIAVGIRTGRRRWSGSPPAAGLLMCWAPSPRPARLGAVTCGISCTPDSELSRAVDYPIEPLPGPEILAGSTRLRAGTATKLVLNMISTAVMIRLGHVYGNLMVNVQPTNAKLGGSGAAHHSAGGGRL